MNPVLSFDLEHSKKRLSYYTALKAQMPAQGKKETPVDRWIEIYGDRVRKLERQMSKLGLKTQLSDEAKVSKRA